MQKLIVKLFIKNYKDTENPKVRTKYGMVSSAVGIITNLILCAIKIIAGLLSASVSILADGINNLSDAGSSIITLVGFKLSSKPADEDHPFGHERLEYVTGLIVSIIIIIISISLFRSSLEKVLNPETIKTGVLMYTILGMSILAKLWQAYFYKKMGKTINSTSLIATATDSLNDCISTFAVVIGMIIFDISGWKIDGYVGIFVSIFVLISGIKLVKETASPLIGTMPTEDEVKMIADKITSYEGVLGVHDIVVHSYGPNKTYISAHAEVASNQDIMISHDIIDNIEHDFRVDLNMDLVIHMDPIDIHDEKTQMLKYKTLEILNEYDPNLSLHDFRVVHGITHTNVLFDVVIPTKYNKTPAQVREYLTTKIKEYNDKLNAVIQIDQMYERNT